MAIFRILLSQLTNGINFGFSVAETIFACFGITLLILLVAMACSSFFVRAFVGRFLK